MSTNIAETVRELFSDATLLVRQEINLAKAEAEEKVEQVTYGLVEIGAALIIALTALLVLVQAVVVALSNFMPPSIAALVVGVVLAIVAYISLQAGVNSLKMKNLTPRRTIAQVQEDVDTIREAT